MGFKHFFWVLATIVAFALCACRTTHVMTETTQADTIIQVQVVHDSIHIVQVHRDSTYLHDSIYVVADSTGKVTYKERWHTLYKYVYASDSLSYYKAQADSLKSASRSTKQVTEVVESRNWKRAYFACLLCLIATIVVVWRMARK